MSPLLVTPPNPSVPRLHLPSRRVPVVDCAPSTASARRTARSIPGSDTAPGAPATVGFPLRLPPTPTPAVRTLWPRIPRALVPRAAARHPLSAAPVPPVAARQAAVVDLRLADAPTIAGTRDSSAPRLAA